MGSKTPKLAQKGGDPVTAVDPGFTELWQPVQEEVAIGRPEDVLLANGQVTPAQLEEAVRQQSDAPHLRILEVLVQSKVITELQAYQAIAAAAKLPFMRLETSMVERAVLDEVPMEFLRVKHVIPIRREGELVLLGLSDPTDIFLLDDLRHRLRSEVRAVVVLPSEIEAIINELSDSGSSQIEEIIRGVTEDSVEVLAEENQEVADLQRVAGESPVIRYVNYTVSSAVRQGASDIHIEPGENCLYVRFRIDGVLFEQQAPPLGMHAAVISRLKIMAGLDIAERRLPQDGRIRVTVQGQRMDLRVSTMPTVHGEKCVIRILDNRSILLGLERLGMAQDTERTFRQQVLQPHGIVMVTGPTGSGKSTTLYSALRIMDAASINISTVEDPVEYMLAHVNQVNVNEGIGLTFANTLRSLLRQDPDVIMVGEIRDAETAKVAIQASLTGHMVLSTLHTNDAPSSVTRLINIGIEPYLIGASVNAILAQRLVRRICDHCKKPMTEIKDPVRVFLDKHETKVDSLFVGAGCEKCRQTGYKGRVGLYELLTLTEELRDVIARSPSLGEFRRAAREAGMRDLRQDGIRKMCEGMTTVEEVMLVSEA